MDKRYKITVLVPTYRRPQDLLRCLTALQNQTRSPDEVLVVVRDTDEETWNFLKTYRIELLPLRILIVSVPGVIAAMNLGFETAQGDIISVTDDDAAPHTDWLERIEAHFVADTWVDWVDVTISTSTVFSKTHRFIPLDLPLSDNCNGSVVWSVIIISVKALSAQ
jgi:glycosyltransferase involved in cell wall biosynthesis